MCLGSGHAGLREYSDQRVSGRVSSKRTVVQHEAPASVVRPQLPMPLAGRGPLWMEGCAPKHSALLTFNGPFDDALVHDHAVICAYCVPLGTLIGGHAMAADNSGKLGVFISYSRNDLQFADQLDVALGLTGFTTTIDRHGISGGEDWKRRLGNLIRDADTVVFVLSPTSATSDICHWEVDEAVRLGKRILPVLCRPLDGASPPPQLHNLNYIYFYDEPKSPGSGFGTGMVSLVSALNTDLDWLREHTRYLQRATEWQAGGRPANRLLSGSDIGFAKAWATGRPKNAPDPTELQLDFIRASESWDKQQQSEERKRLEEVARAQEEKAKALADIEVAQKRESEAAKRAEAEALRAAEEATRAAEASKTVAKRTLAGLAASLLLAAIAAVAGLYAFKQKHEATAQSEAALQALRVAVAWEFTEKDPKVSVAFLREVKVPEAVRGWWGATAKTLETLNGSSKITLKGHTDKISSALFSPNANWIVTSSGDKTARVWDGKTGTGIAVLEGHTDFLTSAIFSPDATRIVTGSWDKTARVWDARTGKLLMVL